MSYSSLLAEVSPFLLGYIICTYTPPKRFPQDLLSNSGPNGFTYKSMAPTEISTCIGPIEELQPSTAEIKAHLNAVKVLTRSTRSTIKMIMTPGTSTRLLPKFKVLPEEKLRNMGMHTMCCWLE